MVLGGGNEILTVSSRYENEPSKAFKISLGNCHLSRVLQATSFIFDLLQKS